MTPQRFARAMAEMVHRYADEALASAEHSVQSPGQTEAEALKTLLDFDPSFLARLDPDERARVQAILDRDDGTPSDPLTAALTQSAPALLAMLDDANRPAIRLIAYNALEAMMFELLNVLDGTGDLEEGDESEFGFFHLDFEYADGARRRINDETEGFLHDHFMDATQARLRAQRSDP
ncbi:MAG: hypothetical protein AAGC92_16485 [Pseudomonadota bacterium]